MCVTRASPSYMKGTNGIQALDLVGRKLAENYGQLARPFSIRSRRLSRAQQGYAELAEFLPYFRARSVNYSSRP